jgi:hypothetical protein
MTVPPGPSQQPWPQFAPPRSQRWQMVTLAVIALASLALALGSWFRPLPSTKTPSAPAAPVYTAQQTADAKAAVCAAFAKVDRALDVAAAQHASGDTTAVLAVATSVRQVLEVGSRYLLTKLGEQPAAPPDLAKEVREFADSSQDLVIGYLDGLTASDADLQPSRHTGDETTLAIRQLCK